MKSKYILNFTVLLTIFSSIIFCSAQTQFQRTIGGPGNEEARTIVQTTDGGYALGGLTYSYGAGATDIYVIKLNSSGSLQWSKTIGGTNYDVAYSMIQTTDGGFAAAGYTNSFGLGGAGIFDMYIVKLDANGTLQWSKAVGGTATDGVNSIIQTTDGGYALAGWTNSFGAGFTDFFIVKLDANGAYQWSKTIGGPSYDVAMSILQTTDGGYAVGGVTSSFGEGDYDVYLVKLDASGSLQWSKTCGGPGDDDAYSLIQTTDGYVLAGYTYSFGAGNSDLYIVKFSSSGALLWTKAIGGPDDEQAYSLTQTANGNYEIAGITTSYGAGSFDMYIINLDPNGSLLWSKTRGELLDDGANSIVHTSDGGFIAAGTSNSYGAADDFYIVKFDSSGNTCGNTSTPSSSVSSGGIVGTPTPTINSQTPIVTTTPSITSTGGTVNTICVTGIKTLSNDVPASFKLEQNYPNPFNPKTNINYQLPKNSYVNITVFNSLGEKIDVLVNQKQNAGEYSVDWDGTKFPSGVYFYKFSAGDYSKTNKMILLK